MNGLADRCRVVLVRPGIAANIGSVARAMANFGLTDLVLVAPEASPMEESARRLATHGEGILSKARIVSDFSAAVGDCVMVVGTSARTEGLIRGYSVVTPHDFMPKLLQIARNAPVALIFGPENTGLTNAEVIRCQHLLTIPANEAYPVLNLAQSVVICLYELHMAGQKETALEQTPELADHATQEKMYQHLEQSLREVHFLWDERAEVQMNAIRQLLGRAQLSETECGLLHGIARQLEWYARTYGPRVE